MKRETSKQSPGNAIEPHPRKNPLVTVTKNKDITQLSSMTPPNRAYDGIEGLRVLVSRVWIETVNKYVIFGLLVDCEGKDVNPQQASSHSPFIWWKTLTNVSASGQFSPLEFSSQFNQGYI